MSKVSKWQSGKIKPTIVGVYERYYARWVLTSQFCWWDGKLWSEGSAWVVNADHSSKFPSRYQNLRWRGLIDE